MNDHINPKGAATQNTVIQHTFIATGLDYDAAVAAFEHELSQLDPALTQRLVKEKAPWSEVEREIGAVGGKHGLMIITRAEQGKVISLSGSEKKCALYIVGNPVIASQIIAIDRRASFYVPFRVAIYDDPNLGSAVISYDRPSSFLATLGRPELTEFGKSLDGKIDSVVAAIRGR